MQHDAYSDLEPATEIEESEVFFLSSTETNPSLNE